MEFKKYKISDVAEVIGGGTPSTKKAEYYGSDIPWITPKDLSNHKKRYITYGEKSITNLGLQKSSAKLLPTNTVLFTSRAPIGYVAIAGNQISTNQGFKSLICNENLILPEYMYYLMKFSTPDIENLATGSTFKEVSGSIIKNFEIELPNIIEQEKIINILSSLDSKIELNNNIISNLEQLSQTLFKQWFIDFEFPNEEGKPYKSSGGEMVESELGEIPKGWCVSEIDNLGTIIGGGTPSKKYDEYYTNNGISWITPKDLSNDKNTFIYKGAIDITELGLKKSSARILQKDTVLFSSRAPIGYIAIAGKEVTTNQGFKSIVPDKGYSSYFIYHLLKFKLPMIEAAAGGSTFKEISGKGLKEIPVTLPTVELVNIYKEIVEPLFLQIQTLEKENQNLQQLRDTLLPKLLSGEIEIPDDLEV